MTALVALDDVSRIYRRRSRTGSRAVTALDGVTLRIGSGECVAVMGASGSGKSTLLAVLGALDTPTSGTYRLEGTNIGRLDDVRLARLRNRRLGFVFQAFHLLPRLSAAENVELPLRYGGGPGRLERAALVATALASVGLTHRADHRPAELSGGQQQRVAIARALVNDPALILADEPTGNLDPSNAASVLNLLAGLPEQGRTLVVVTHDPAIAARAGRVLRLEGGRLASDEGRLTLASAGLGR